MIDPLTDPQLLSVVDDFIDAIWDIPGLVQDKVDWTPERIAKWNSVVQEDMRIQDA